MNLGAFSVSLAVKDLAKSKAFYEHLGFSEYAGEQEQNWLILKNGEHLIGLFEGMFDKNILTFNPGWDQSGNPLTSFQDVRVIQQTLKANGITPGSEVDENSSGPGSFMVTDPDGNTLLFDQHV